MRLLNHFLIKSIMCMVYIAIISFPCSAEIQGDIELLKTVALANQANYESILTWKSDVSEEIISSTGDNYEQTLKAQCEMAYDQLKQAVRWNKTPKEFYDEKDGERKIDKTDFHGYYESSMFIKSSYYNYIDNKNPDEIDKDFYILKIDDPKKAAGWSEYSFDPRLLLADPHGHPIFVSLMLYYKDLKDSEPGYVNINRSGDLVTLELAIIKNLSNKYVFDLSKGGNLVEWVGKQNGLVITQKCTFENISGSWVLKTFYKTNYDPTRKEVTTRKRTLEFSNSVVNVPFEEDEFTVKKMGVKEGEMIQDHLAEKIYRYDGTFQEPLRSPQPLAGKKMPYLVEDGINLSNADANDKTILLCFFEMEQRPSRNSMTELSKKAQELKSKDIEVIAIHASKIEQEKLDEWVKENGINFPVGMIVKDEEQTRFNWGVKALPWLILTDKEHIVKAEGFSVEELDEKIKL